MQRPLFAKTVRRGKGQRNRFIIIVIITAAAFVIHFQYSDTFRQLPEVGLDSAGRQSNAREQTVSSLSRSSRSKARVTKKKVAPPSDQIKKPPHRAGWIRVRKCGIGRWCVAVTPSTKRRSVEDNRGRLNLGTKKKSVTLGQLFSPPNHGPRPERQNGKWMKGNEAVKTHVLVCGMGLGVGWG